MASKFELGTLVATASVDERMNSDKGFAAFVQTSVGKYANCDWGDTCEEDKKTNEDALRNGERLLAVYKYPKTGETIWIITEWDRSATTILFPSEYRWRCTVTKKEVEAISVYADSDISYIAMLPHTCGCDLSQGDDFCFANKLTDPVSRIVEGEPKSLQSQIDAARCTKSLKRHIEQHGYRGEQNV